MWIQSRSFNKNKKSFSINPFAPIPFFENQKDPFQSNPGFRALVSLRDPFDDLRCVEGISTRSDRLRKARGSNGTGENIQKRRLVLVSDFGSVSSFFRDELLAPVLHFVSVLWTEEKGSSAARGL
ncbi:hypothetical protein Ahy_A08g038867 [Arachis hypogaea]|uniref:Uncharacterized protein n=1 Tax=Arachis hypogaea TaxID=3818 RepID=A0A445BUK8_ARAHY|nr:hypothetical protein Ahy_B08g092964 [Arachis hypogaea]RYR42394.1 hypothetical protein Ahy_A08g038867 [Arachis hypogaea]